MGLRKYSLRTVTVLSELSVVTGAELLPFTEVSQVMVAGGRPLADSQRATATAVSPTGTVMVVAELVGLAGRESR